MPAENEALEPQDIGPDLARLRQSKEQAALKRAEGALAAGQLSDALSRLQQEMALLRQQLQQLDESA